MFGSGSFDSVGIGWVDTAECTTRKSSIELTLSEYCAKSYGPWSRQCINSVIEHTSVS